MFDAVGPLYTQSVSATTASGIPAANIPAGARYAEGFCRGDVALTTDGSTTPTSALGQQAASGDTIILRSREELRKYSGIGVSVDTTIDWEFYNSNPDLE